MTSLFRILPFLPAVALLACSGVSDQTRNALGGPPITANPDASSGDVAVGDGAIPLDDASAPDTNVVDTFVPPPPANDTCATATPLVAEAKYKEVTGNSGTGHDEVSGHSCHAGAGNDVMFSIDHPGGDLALDTVGSSFDTVIVLRRACENRGTEMACSHRTNANAGSSRLLYRGLEKGTYFVIVDAVAGGGAFRLGYMALPSPRDLSCDAPPVVISDAELGAAPVGAGADIFDRISNGAGSKVSLRTGESGKDLCPTATGQMAFGQGSEQVYKLVLKKPTNVLRARTSAIEPLAFTSTGTPRFDIFAYIRKGDGPPASDPVANCKQSSSDVSDICLPVNTGVAVTLGPGTYWLVIDSLSGSQGRFHFHVDVEN